MEKKSKGHLWDEVTASIFPETVYPSENHDSSPCDGNRDGDKVDVNTHAEQNRSMVS